MIESTTQPSSTFDGGSGADDGREEKRGKHERDEPTPTASSSSALFRPSSRSPSPKRVKDEPADDDELLQYLLETDEQDKGLVQPKPAPDADDADENDEDIKPTPSVLASLTADYAPLLPPPGTARRALLDSILRAVPDAHPLYVLRLLDDPATSSDPEVVVAELSTSDYMLVEGGWKLGGGGHVGGGQLVPAPIPAQAGESGPSPASQAKAAPAAPPKTPPHRRRRLPSPEPLSLRAAPAPAPARRPLTPPRARDFAPEAAAYGLARAGNGVFGGGAPGGGGTGAWRGGRGTRADASSGGGGGGGKGREGARDEPEEVRRTRMLVAAKKREAEEKRRGGLGG
ncbi:hypothetical protein JCM10207_008296 [Rhodosporidiobolus poonsookiae]